MVSAKNLTFRYPSETNCALNNISLEVKRGEFVVICGKSGCGKSTLLRHFKTAVTPYGETEGQVYYSGTPISDMSIKEQSMKIGFVTQNPDNQIVTDKVWHELAFGAESLGYPNEEIRKRVAEVSYFFGIHTWFHKKTTELSGGQKQLLNLASVMVLQPELIILDEPTSRLDPIAAQDFLAMLSRINRELGITVILSEHRLEETVPLADRVIVMKRGRIICDCKPSELCGKNIGDMTLALPTAVRAYRAVEKGTNSPVTVREGREWLSKAIPKRIEYHADKAEPRTDKPLMVLKDIRFRYEKNSADIIKDLSLKIYKGEFYAIVGGNGAGKTTALSVMAGLLKPYSGKLVFNSKDKPKCVLLPQDPQTLFLKNTVYEEISRILSDGCDKKERIDEVVKLCELEELLYRHPYDLSGGEQQRTAMAMMLLKNPDIFLLDEPTKGMDAHFKIKLAKILKKLNKKGITIIAVSHDVEFCAEFADRCGMFFDGKITGEDIPREFFSKNNFYTTAADRMSRGIIDGAVLCEDIIKAMGGQAEEYDDEDTDSYIDDNLTTEMQNDNIPKKKSFKKKVNKSTLLSILTAALLIPFTLLFGDLFLGSRKYYFISLLIILEAMIPFFKAFEGKKPRAAEIVILSTMCAIAVTGNAVFYPVPQFKPAAAMVIISGACFGGGAGFLVGAVTAFVSNFLFGQGVWTPWQMFSLGIIGFLSGILCETGALKKKRLWLTIFGFISVLVLYGGIMNISNVIIYQSKPTVGLITASFATGFSFDMIHAVSTVVFLWLASDIMIEKIERVKKKYGIT